MPVSLFAEYGMSEEPLTFFASIAPTESALKAHGLEGFRVLLDLPETETPAYVRLLLCRGHVLRITVEAMALQTEGVREPARRRKAKRKQAEDDGPTENTDRYFSD